MCVLFLGAPCSSANFARQSPIYTHTHTFTLKYNFKLSLRQRIVKLTCESHDSRAYKARANYNTKTIPLSPRRLDFLSHAPHQSPFPNKALYSTHKQSSNRECCSSIQCCGFNCCESLFGESHISIAPTWALGAPIVDLLYFCCVGYCAEEEGFFTNNTYTAPLSLASTTPYHCGRCTAAGRSSCIAKAECV